MLRRRELFSGWTDHSCEEIGSFIDDKKIYKEMKTSLCIKHGVVSQNESFQILKSQK